MTGHTFWLLSTWDQVIKDACPALPLAWLLWPRKFSSLPCPAPPRKCPEFNCYPAPPWGFYSPPRPTPKFLPSGLPHPFGGRVSLRGGENETRRKCTSSKWRHWGVQGKPCGDWGLHYRPGAHSGRTRSYLLLGDIVMTSHVVIEDSKIYQVCTLGGPDRHSAQEGNVEYFIT